MKIKTSKTVLIRKYLERASLPESVSFFFMQNVLESVEEFGGVFQAYLERLKPKGVVAQKFDLTSHRLLKGPISLLDFKTYPDRVYALLQTETSLSTRQVLSAYIYMVKGKGLQNIRVECLKKAHAVYVGVIWSARSIAARFEPNDSTEQPERLLLT